ncbi:MAG: hypothetical protein ACYCZK_04965 [Microbacteriaceae bacterium]
MISVPRFVIVGLAALFSLYHEILALYSLSLPRDPAPVVMAMVLYAVATTASLWPAKSSQMPVWLAAVNVAVSAALCLLVTSQLDPRLPGGTGYATWYVAAIGTLMVITSTRRRHLFAWLGVGFLAVQTVVWSGPGALAGLGVIGSLVWVALSHVLSRSLTKAVRDLQHYAVAEREAADWQAAQEAHLHERQFRLAQTSRMAMPVLEQIVLTEGNLTREQRRECWHLESAIRDEIRGRKLLNDRVRQEVMAARRRGTVVTLLDEGGLDDLTEEELDHVLTRLAEVIQETVTDRLIARTVPEGSETAITVVGLSSAGDSSVSALGQHGVDDTEEEVDLWLEIPRPRLAAPAVAVRGSRLHEA